MSPREIDPSELPLDPAEAGPQAPSSGTVDDDDNRDDESPDENEAPTRELSDLRETRDEFVLDKREEDRDSPAHGAD